MADESAAAVLGGPQQIAYPPQVHDGRAVDGTSSMPRLQDPLLCPACGKKWRAPSGMLSVPDATGFFHVVPAGISDSAPFPI